MNIKSNLLSSQNYIKNVVVNNLIINIVQNKTHIKRKIITRIFRCEFHTNIKISSQLIVIDSVSVDIDITDYIHHVDEQRQSC